MNEYRATILPSVLFRAAASRQAIGLCQTVRAGRVSAPAAPRPSILRYHGIPLSSA